MQLETEYPGEGVDFTLGNRVTAVGRPRFNQRVGENLLYRPLHIYTLDPSVSYLQGGVAVVKVPYEPLEPGPIGSLIEVVDSDVGDGPAERLDLDDPRVLIQNGRLPSPRDRLFRQQMVYAVASLTYAAFQRALGRQLTWGFTRESDGDFARLRIRPHSEEMENAHYRSDTGELCFGYYPAREQVKGRNIPGGKTYTCLSHDIIVHETSHALLDGLRSSFQEGTIPDVDAFHEAFADIVAIFQHFSYYDVVLAALQESRGNLRSASLLMDIAQQFGHTTGAGGPLRTSIDVTKKRGTPLQYATAGREPHALGTVLVSAIFEAFTTVFERKTALYIRLATGGTGRLPKGELPADLQQILTKTAQTLAKQFLTICIRAIDYCPPVDI